MACKFFTSHAKSKKFLRHVFSDHKRKNFGTQTDRVRDITPVRSKRTYHKNNK
uniref:DUF1661 domain-containing protein n=1 Tax=Porphyromonas gingivalis TaxID=837 RepID=UPI001E44C464|nr:DUF1661 domain-containing protein [Porphyromonas gingivalis]